MRRRVDRETKKLLQTGGRCEGRIWGRLDGVAELELGTEVGFWWDAVGHGNGEVGTV